MLEQRLQSINPFHVSALNALFWAFFYQAVHACVRCSLSFLNGHRPVVVRFEPSQLACFLIADSFEVIVPLNMTPTIRRSVSWLAIAFALNLGGAFSVSAQTPPAQNRPLAVVVVLDKSGSNAGGTMTLSKEGAKAALAQMRKKDLFGVMAFTTPSSG